MSTPPRKRSGKQGRAEAEARRQWLMKLGDVVDWLEFVVGQTPNEFLEWYTKTGSPGMVELGITVERIEAAIRQLERIRAMNGGGHAEAPRADSSSVNHADPIVRAAKVAAMSVAELAAAASAAVAGGTFTPRRWGR